MYGRIWKRVLDFVVSLFALLVLSPLLAILTIVGCAAMRGNPFFVQPRPGKDERIFRLVKFRTMTNARDDRGELLPDEARLNGYGRFLRSTSLDELPELWNVLKGDMSLVGPRPLLPDDVVHMSKAQNRRHEVRPGMTGLAQCNGRNGLNWDQKLAFDVQYVDGIDFVMDCRIVIRTIGMIFARDGVNFEEGMDISLKDWNAISEK